MKQNRKELQDKLEKFLSFAAEKNLKLKTKKFNIGYQVEFGGSVLTGEKVENVDLVLLHLKERESRHLKS